jgi:hypothetical protein
MHGEKAQQEVRPKFLANGALLVRFDYALSPIHYTEFGVCSKYLVAIRLDWPFPSRRLKKLRLGVWKGPELRSLASMGRRKRMPRTALRI